MKADRTGIVIRPDPRRVLFRPFNPHTTERSLKIVARVMAMPESEVDAEVERIFEEFHDRHLRLPKFFLRRFEQNRHYLITDQVLSDNRQLLIGSYFTAEYSLECAALFNPSMIWHPDQSNLPDGDRRFIISLRATGEGQISSIVFRPGVIDADYGIQLDPTSRFVTTPDTRPDHSYEKALFQRKLVEIELAGQFVERVLTPLGDQFSFGELREQIRVSLRTEELKGHNFEQVAKGMLSLAESNYTVCFSEGQQLWERILFPSTPAEVKGLEDARFVEFTNDDGSRIFYATYTAYNGNMFIPQLLETTDFLRFRMSTLNGPAVQNKIGRAHV